MKTTSGFSAVADHVRLICFGFVALAVTIFLAPAVHSAGGGPYKPSDAVSFEEIPGSKVKRVILTEKAVERLGLETGEIGEAAITRTQVVGGRVVLPVEFQDGPALAAAGSFGSFGPTPAAGSQARVVAKAEPDPDKEWIRVTLSPGEWDRIVHDEPVRILPLATRGDFETELLATPSGELPVVDPKRSMLTLYYLVPRKDHGLRLHDRVRVEMKLEGGGETRKVAPYGAVYYDGQPAAWVYVNTKPLTYERQPITIERIEGNLAILSDGPPVGTTVVTAGAALLYGAEVIYKR